MDKDLLLVAKDDEMGRQLQDLNLITRKRTISQVIIRIQTAEPDADVRDGLRASDANDSSIENWIADNGISE